MQRRIFFWLAPILIPIAAIGVYAIALFKELSSKVDHTLRENYRGEVAGSQIRVSLSAMDFGFFSTVGEEIRSEGFTNRTRRSFPITSTSRNTTPGYRGEQQLADILLSRSQASKSPQPA